MLESGRTTMEQRPNAAHEPEDTDDVGGGSRSEVESLRRPRVANVNVPERIVICLDVCHDERTSLFKCAISARREHLQDGGAALERYMTTPVSNTNHIPLQGRSTVLKMLASCRANVSTRANDMAHYKTLDDGTTFTHLNMLKRVLEFFLHTKHAISPLSQFALVLLRDGDARWTHGFTSNVRELLVRLDTVTGEQSTAGEFPLGQLLEVLERNTEVPSSEGAGLVAPPFVLRLLLLYGRSSCVPRLPQPHSPFLDVLRRHLYVYTDILLAHEEDCDLYRCEEVYDALQCLENGYSYVFEVSRNANKIHDCVAKLLAHPLQRPLQKCANYDFPARQH